MGILRVNYFVFENLLTASYFTQSSRVVSGNRVKRRLWGGKQKMKNPLLFGEVTKRTLLFISFRSHDVFKHREFPLWNCLRLRNILSFASELHACLCVSLEPMFKLCNVCVSVCGCVLSGERLYPLWLHLYIPIKLRLSFNTVLQQKVL